MKIEGETKQGGIPTPENPAEIQNVIKVVSGMANFVDGLSNINKHKTNKTDMKKEQEVTLNYEEYKSIMKEAFKKTENKYIVSSKKEFEEFMSRIKRIEEFEKKIDKLASEYILETNNIVLGYYEILEYCLKKIRERDINLSYKFSEIIKEFKDYNYKGNLDDIEFIQNKINSFQSFFREK